MSARERILAAARAALGDPAERRAAVEGRLSARTQSAPTPRIARLEGRARIDFFAEQAEAVNATVSRLSRLSELPAALKEELTRRKLLVAIRFGDDADLAALDWSGLEVSRGPGAIDSVATLSQAYAGIAETGTLALLSGPDNPVTLTFLGETHFALIRASRIEAGFEGVWTRLRAANRDPRTVNLVTGPSRTADIGQRLELGAHGPIDLHIFVLEDF